MKTLILSLILIVGIACSVNCQSDTVFEKIFQNKDIGSDLGKELVSDKKLIFLYDPDIGLSAKTYLSILHLTGTGFSIFIETVPKEEGIRSDSLKNFNKAVLQQLESIYGPGKGLGRLECRMFPGESTSVYSRYPIIEYFKDTNQLTENSKCIIDKFYVPLMNLPINGNWRLIIHSEGLGVRDIAQKRKRANHLKNYLIEKGISKEIIIITPGLLKPESGYYYQEYLLGLDIEILK
ncbi:MAG: hypothetical protein AAFY45_35270 [Bacteroidota bacterium]